jgi:hypothetical protein
VNRIAVGLLGLVFCASASAQSIDRPEVRAGDTWIYRITQETGQGGWNQTRDELTVTRVTDSTIYFDIKPAGSTQAPKEIYRGSDWSSSRDVNGKETVTMRPMAFPLSAGKTWAVTYTQPNPNKNKSTETTDDKYHVVGYETVEVPAGKYRALKIEAEGRWSAQLMPGQTVTQDAQSHASGASMSTQIEKTTGKDVSGRLYKAFWYVPEIKRWVKSVEEDYNSGGVRNGRRTMELESYKAAASG